VRRGGSDCDIEVAAEHPARSASASMRRAPSRTISSIGDDETSVLSHA